MLALIATVPLWFAFAALPDGEPAPTVTVDGGDVPTVAPELTPTLAPVMAPELVHDGGTEPMVAPATLSVYRVDLPVEATVTVGSLGLFVIVDFLIKPTLEGDISCRRTIGVARCNSADLTAADRYSVGRESKEWRAFGDVALATSLLLPVIYLGLESLALPTTEPWGDFANDLLVVTESMAVTGALQQVMKFAFRRPRPIRYVETDAPVGTFDQELSFPSGHVALVAAATTALTTTVFLRHPGSKLRYFFLGGGMLLTVLTAVSRIESGQHFLTDVAVGALLGGFAGFSVPYLHRKEVRLKPSASVDFTTGRTSFGVSGSF